MLWLTMLWGCGPARLSGEVDGHRVSGARDAVYDTYSLELGPFDWDFVAITIASFPDACDLIDDISEAYEGSCEDRCEEIVAISEEHGLRDDEYWTFSMLVNVSDGDEGEFDYESDTSNIEDEEFAATFSRWDGRQLTDRSACEEACEDGELLDPDDEQGEDGTLEITRAEGEVFSGRFDVDLGGDEGARGGFDARPCNTEDWILAGWSF